MSNIHQKVLEQYIEESITQILNSHAVGVLSRTRQSDWIAAWPAKVYSSVIGFNADGLSGNLNICCDEELLLIACPDAREIANPMERDELFRDWLGEITNMTIGHFARKLQNHKIKLRINPPSVFSASSEIIDRYEEMSPCQYIWFGIEDGKFCLQLGTTVDGSINWMDFADQGNPNPGEIIQLKSGAQLNQLASKEPVPAASARPSTATEAVPSSALTAPAASSSHVPLSGALGEIAIHWNKGQGQLSFALPSGMTMAVKVHDIVNAGKERSFQIGQEKFKLIGVKNGLVIDIDGLRINLPLAA